MTSGPATSELGAWRGEAAGPTLILVGGIHGNEPAGIDACRRVLTHLDPRAIACAGENLARLGLAGPVEVVRADLFPEGRAAIAVCNPPWVPARPSSPLEHGIYDPESRMLLGFLRGLPAHLVPGGHRGERARRERLPHGGNARPALRPGDEWRALPDAVSRSDRRPRVPRCLRREVLTGLRAPASGLRA